MKTDILERYFDWLYELVCGKWEPRNLSFHKLLEFLFWSRFYPSCEMDRSRAVDGTDLRYRFAKAMDISYAEIEENFKGRPCSMLEMMVALALRCEEHIMEDAEAGNRIGQWFWNMVVSLGLAAMDDTKFNANRAAFVLERFNRRDYQPNGAGGLFTVSRPMDDMRTLDIWYQMMAYLNENDI